MPKARKHGHKKKESAWNRLVKETARKHPGMAFVSVVKKAKEIYRH